MLFRAQTSLHRILIYNKGTFQEGSNITTWLLRFCPIQELFLTHHLHWFLISFSNSFVTHTAGRYSFCLWRYPLHFFCCCSCFFLVAFPPWRSEIQPMTQSRQWCDCLWLETDWGCCTVNFPQSSLTITFAWCFWIIITRTSQVLPLLSFSFCPNIIIH